jgi:hypothetical protein
MILEIEQLFDRMFRMIPPEYRYRFEPYREKIEKAIRRHMNDKAIYAIQLMFLSLYSYDTDALRCDAAKLLLFDDELNTISEQERKDLLRVLWKSIQTFFPDQDYSVLFNDWVSRSIWRKTKISDGYENEDE